eukprot:scaffold847_cov385-Prasinococcus_capsulatus_cf.AAC.7
MGCSTTAFIIWIALRGRHRGEHTCDQAAGAATIKWTSPCARGATRLGPAERVASSRSKSGRARESGHIPCNKRLKRYLIHGSCARPSNASNGRQTSQA